MGAGGSAVRADGRQLSYGVYESEEDAYQAQARWRLTHLLPEDDPELLGDASTNVAVGGVRCGEWFERWQVAKLELRSLVRLGNGRGGAATTAARDRAQWLKWWSPSIGDELPQTVLAATLSAHGLAAVFDHSSAGGLWMRAGAGRDGSCSVSGELGHGFLGAGVVDEVLVVGGGGDECGGGGVVQLPG